MKHLLLIGMFSTSAFAQSAPYCVVSSSGTNCSYYQQSTCMQAARSVDGTCIVRVNLPQQNSNPLPVYRPQSNVDADAVKLDQIQNPGRGMKPIDPAAQIKSTIEIMNSVGNLIDESDARKRAAYEAQRQQQADAQRNEMARQQNPLQGFGQSDYKSGANHTEDEEDDPVITAENYQLYKLQMDYYQSVLQNPNSSEMQKNRAEKVVRRCERGFLLYAQQTGQNHQAIEDHNKALESDSINVRAYYDRGIAHGNLGQFDRAIEDFNKAIELDPKFPQAYLYRGTAHSILRQYDKAIEDFSTGIGLDSKSPDNYFGRGTAYARLQQNELAIRDFDKGIELDSKTASAYSARGHVYANLGQNDRAIEDFNKAIELDPKNEYFYFHLVNAAVASKMAPKPFEEKLSNFVAANPSGEWVRTISKFYLGMDGMTEKKLLEEAKKGKDEKEINGRLCEAYYYLGEKWLGKGDRMKALEYFSYSISTNIQDYTEYAQSMAMVKLMRETKR